MKTVEIDSTKITNWDSFHSVFSKAFNIPDYYGKNMDAWIDLMDEIIESPTIIDLGDCYELNRRNPDIIDALLECSAFVNFRRKEMNESPYIILSLFRRK